MAYNESTVMEVKPGTLSGVCSVIPSSEAVEPLFTIDFVNAFANSCRAWAGDIVPSDMKARKVATAEMVLASASPIPKATMFGWYL